jgi:hypothetical protein
VAAVRRLDDEIVFETGVHWSPLLLAAVEGPLAVGASVWFLAVAQQRFAHPLGPLGRALSRSAYAAFLVQGVVLLALMVVLRPIDLPAELKALTVAALGAVGSFALAWLLVARTRLGRLL